VHYVTSVLNAKVYDVARQTDLHHAPRLSQVTNNRVLLKREDQQSIYSFKIRGAYNKMVHLTDEEKQRGVCTTSAGNHAQGVAFSASALGLSAKIFMPKVTPRIKVEAVQALLNEQSEVILTGNVYDEAYAATLACIETEGRTLVHPFNDPLVIAGQGTIGQEILAQSTRENIDAVFCCVGGGGLLAGVGVFLKAVKPSIRVIGVEAEDSAAMTRSLEAGEIVELPSVGLFADGAAVRRVGEETFRLCEAFCDEMITVSTDEICGAIKASFIDTRVVLEPAGALAAAGLKKYAEKTGISGQTLVAVTSGANMDFDRLRFVSERADTSESLIAIWIPEKPGSFLRLYECIYPRNVTEFSYRISGDPASIFLSFQASCTEDRKDVLERLTQSGFRPLDLSSSDLAKTHGRHLVGGRAPASLTMDEALFQFEFPETPGALLRFLNNLPQDLNVSLFHYRSHGADVARVLVAFQVPAKARPQLREYLEWLASKGFKWQEETSNDIYDRFLLEPVVETHKPRKPPPITLY